MRGSDELGSYRHHLWSFLACQTNRINGMQGLVGDRTSEKVACGNTEGHLDVYHLYCGLKPCWRLGPAAAGSHIDVSGLCGHLRPGEYPCSRLPPRALSGSVVLWHLVAMFVVSAVSRNHEKAHDLSFFRL